MNVKFSVTNFWGAALILIGFITQIGHAQTVACPLYYQNNSNAQCTNPIFSPWQYVGDVTQTAYSDLASAAAGEFAALASSPAYCSIQQVGTINQCASSAASLNCLAWGYPPQPVASYDIYGTKYVVPNDGSPFACNTTITSPYAYGVKGSRSVTCPPGYILSNYPYFVIGDPPQPYVPAVSTYPFTCVSFTPVTAQIRLTGLHQIEPDQPLPATALVTDSSGNPLPGATVHLRVDAVPNSGGHGHGDDSSPLRRGKLSGVGPEIVATVPTDATGAYPFAFDAPAVAGTYLIIASCADRQCTQVGPNSVDAKIDGLEALPNSLFYSAVPAISHPPGTHYVTASAADKLELLSLYYSVGFFPDIHGPIAITAGSLEWGGLYDIDRDWRPPHIEHRRGTIVDVRANGAAGAIGPANFAKFRSVCRQVNADCKIHSAGTANQHFHVRLFGVAE